MARIRGGQANTGTRSRGTTGGTANRGAQSSLQPGGGHARRDSNRKQAGRRNNEEMSEAQLVGFLGRKIWQAMNDEDGDISDVRQENFNYYIGQEYGNERDGYSKFVTREAMETIEWVLPSVLRVFLSGDKIVTFDPVAPEDEKGAEQETDITNYFVMKANKAQGFLSLHHWMKDALMYPNGYIKAYIEEATHTDVGVVTGLNEIGVQMLSDDPEVDIIEQRSRMVKAPPPGVQQMPQGAPGGVPQQPQGNVSPFPQQEMEVFDLKIRTTKTCMELRVEPVPPEECLVDNDLTSLNLDEADFVAHRVRKTYTQLVNEGYDGDELDQIGLGQDYQWNDERVNRLFYEDEDPDAEDEDDPSMRTFWVHECYVWVDFNGDGLGEQRRVILIGDRVFENEETNYQPMIAMSSILMQHKHTGMSYIDIMKDLQLLGSVLTRQLLDNIYKINVRRKVFSEDALTDDGATMEALLNVQAEYIPVRGPAANAFVPEPTQSIVAELLPVIQHFSAQQATRTGVSPESAVDGNDLQEVRQDVFANALDRASQRIEMLVRIFAETGYRQLMLKVHQLLRSHWDMEKTIKLRGEWIAVDPQGWRDRTDMTINVGLGYNTKQAQLGMLVQLLSMQKEAAGQGLSTPSKIYNTLDKLVNAAGVGDVRRYFVDPESPEFQPPEPQPDANMILAQAQAKALEADSQIKSEKNQIDGQTSMAKMQSDAQSRQVDSQIKQVDQQIKMRELALKEIEIQQNNKWSDEEMRAKIDNVMADSELKRSMSDKAMAEGTATAIEAGETYQQAMKMVSESGDENESDEISMDAELDMEGVESRVEGETDTEGNGNGDSERPDNTNQ